MGYEVVRKWNNFKFSYQDYRNSSLGGIERLSSKYSEYKEIEVRSLDKKNFKGEMNLFYSQLSKSFEDKADYESISFRDFYSFYENLKSILDPRLINFSSYKGENIGFMIAYADYTEALSLKDTLDDKWYIPSFVSKLVAFYKLKQKPSKIFVSFVGKDDSNIDKDIKGVILRHHEALINYLDSISFEGDIYFTYLEEGSNSDLQTKRLNPNVYDRYNLYQKKLLLI